METPVGWFSTIRLRRRLRLPPCGDGPGRKALDLGADNAGDVRYLVEAGPGLMLTHLLDVSPDRITDAQISLSAQYRMPVSDNTAQKNALVVLLNLHL